MNVRTSAKWSVALLLLAAIGIGNTWADRGHHHGTAHFGVVIAPAWSPWYFPPPYYYPSYQPIVIERAPPVYVEQAVPPPAPQAVPTGYWYYCSASRAYYPYVRECAGGWRRVLPEPQN